MLILIGQKRSSDLISIFHAETTSLASDNDFDYFSLVNKFGKVLNNLWNLIFHDVKLFSIICLAGEVPFRSYSGIQSFRRGYRLETPGETDHPPGS